MSKPHKLAFASKQPSENGQKKIPESFLEVHHQKSHVDSDFIGQSGGSMWIILIVLKQKISINHCCVENKMIVSRSADALFNAFRISPRTIGSSPDMGSSRIKISGCLAMAIAIASRIGQS